MSIIKKIFPVMLPVYLLSACTTGSQQQEQKALECWVGQWLPGVENAQAQFTEGREALDQYLFNNHFLEKGTPDDYIRFASDTQQVIIPTHAPGFEKIKLFLDGSYPGTPDAVALSACLKENIESHLEEMDSTDVMYRFGTFYQALESSGAPFASTFDFYHQLTKEELDRPLIKTFFYLTLGSGRYEKPKICLGQRIQRDPINISLPVETTNESTDTTEQ